MADVTCSVAVSILSALAHDTGAIGGQFVSSRRLLSALGLTQIPLAIFAGLMGLEPR